MTETETAPPARILPVIVLAQLAGTSLWFSANAVLADMGSRWRIDPTAVGAVTAAVQLGFIAGTLGFAVFGVADRFSARKVFCLCAVGGAVLNLWLLVGTGGAPTVLALRAATGICLAGIYPVGMKIAAGWYVRGLGQALGYLIGALVLGTAMPHLVRMVGADLPWETVVGITSAIAAAGGILLLLLVPDGPCLPASAPFRLRGLGKVMMHRPLRAAALSYFGHMWELYAFWAFVPVLVAAYNRYHPAASLNVSGWSFAVIAAGAGGCILGGNLSRRVGSIPVAAGMLAVSGGCCLLAPLICLAPPLFFIGALLVWGAAAAGDSPQFSAVVAVSAPPDRVGAALTMLNGIGFAVTIVSITLLEMVRPLMPSPALFTLLAPGPLLGLAALRLAGKRTATR